MIILPGTRETKQDAKADTKPDAKSGAKEELDIYRFRPAEAPSAIAAEIANRPRPRKRKTPQLTLAQAPSLDGLKLGMTPAQVLALFPGSETDKEVQSDLSRPASKFGVSSFMIRPAKYPSATKFSDVSQINFMLLDGRVSTLYVGYEKPVWAHVDEFVAEFNKERNLPGIDHWEAYVGMDTQLKMLKGKEFEISLFAGGNNVNINYVQLRDLMALAKFRERSAKAKKS